MPVEIGELVSRVVILDNDQNPPSGMAGPGQPELDDIIKECVRQTLLILRRERER